MATIHIYVITAAAIPPRHALDLRRERGRQTLVRKRQAPKHRRHPAHRLSVCVREYAPTCVNMQSTLHNQTQRRSEDRSKLSGWHRYDCKALQVPLKKIGHAPIFASPVPWLLPCLLCSENTVPLLPVNNRTPTQHKHTDTSFG